MTGRSAALVTDNGPLPSSCWPAGAFGLDVISSAIEFQMAFHAERFKAWVPE